MGIKHRDQERFLKVSWTISHTTLILMCSDFFRKTIYGDKLAYTLIAVTSSGILKAKQKLGVTFNSDKLGGIAFTKISKLTMCSA